MKEPSEAPEAVEFDLVEYHDDAPKLTERLERREDRRERRERRESRPKPREPGQGDGPEGDEKRIKLE